MNRILVLEDEADLREMISTILALEGYETIEAANGEEGLNRLEQGELPCLILLDLMMPVMNGWEFCSRQKQSATLSPIPIVVLSGDGNTGDKARALGVADYLRKPVRIDALLSIVRRFCGNGAPP